MVKMATHRDGDKPERRHLSHNNQNGDMPSWRRVIENAGPELKEFGHRHLKIFHTVHIFLGKNVPPEMQIFFVHVKPAASE